MLDTLECLRFEQAASTLKIDLKQAHEEHKQNPLEAILDKFYQANPGNSNEVFTTLKNFILAQKWSEGGKLRFVEAISYTAYRQAWKAEKKTDQNNHIEMNIRQQWSRSGVFGLPYLYKKFIGGNQQHRAQADCEALLKVCLVFGEEFLQYINNNKNRVTWKDLNRGIQDSDSQSMVDLYADQDDSLCKPFFIESQKIGENFDEENDQDIDLRLSDSLKALEKSHSERKVSRTSSDLFENSQEKDVKDDQ
uniref:Uncharacterized protein n=1 Tax=Acrobeloides nanus TaxID=290746 RepID=A0A914DA42_9BILA